MPSQSEIQSISKIMHSIDKILRRDNAENNNTMGKHFFPLTGDFT